MLGEALEFEMDKEISEEEEEEEDDDDDDDDEEEEEGEEEAELFLAFFLLLLLLLRLAGLLMVAMRRKQERKDEEEEEEEERERDAKMLLGVKTLCVYLNLSVSLNTNPTHAWIHTYIFTHSLTTHSFVSSNLTFALSPHLNMCVYVCVSLLSFFGENTQLY